MSETTGNRTIFSLLEVTQSIQKTLSERYKSAYWIKAEMNKLNHYPHSGHCYPDLVEKSGGKIIAQLRANIWSDDYQRINGEFIRMLGEPLKDGIKILLLAHITFRPEFGLALRIIDIDPAYTLGDLEKEKQETIIKLKQEGIFDKNKSLELPLLPKRVAIISVQTSKGYADFMKVLEKAESTFGFRFFHFLFPSLLQGDKAVDSIINQLKRVRRVMHHFDVVAIIRGGGGDVGLSCYNHFELAKAIALFPLPVITGIGHATNETVTEMTAYENAITPTHLAELLVQRFTDFSIRVKNAQEKIAVKSVGRLDEEKGKFESEIKLFRSVSGFMFSKNKNDIRENLQTVMFHSRFIFRNRNEELKQMGEHFIKSSGNIFGSQRQKLEQQVNLLRKAVEIHLDRTSFIIEGIGKNVALMNPRHVLKRGYSITLSKGKPVRSHSEVSEGDVIETFIYQGKITSKVESTNKPSKNE